MKPAVWDQQGHLGRTVRSRQDGHAREISIEISIYMHSISHGTCASSAGLNTNIIFPTLANSSSLRATFVSSAVAYAISHGFDGVDLDYEVRLMALDLRPQ